MRRVSIAYREALWHTADWGDVPSSTMNAGHGGTLASFAFALVVGTTLAAATRAVGKAIEEAELAILRRRHGDEPVRVDELGGSKVVFAADR